MNDPYETLGIPRDADIKTITRAYRKLARKYHPDSNPGDTETTAKYHAVTSAYELLSDPVRRKRYDETGDVSNHATAPGPPMDILQPTLIGIMHNSSEHYLTDSDVLEKLRGKIAEYLANHRSNLSQLKNAHKKFSKALGRFTVRDGGENYLESVVKHEVERLDREIAACNAEIERCTTVVEYLRGCDYRIDKKPDYGTWGAPNFASPALGNMMFNFIFMSPSGIDVTVTKKDKKKEKEEKETE
jgi:curved DNA-binding protein CbpA